MTRAALVLAALLAPAAALAQTAPARPASASPSQPLTPTTASSDGTYARQAAQSFMGSAASGTSANLTSQAGFNVAFNTTSDFTNVSVHLGVQRGKWIVDGALVAPVNQNGNPTVVAVAANQPLTAESGVSVGVSFLTYHANINASDMLDACGDVKPCSTTNPKLPESVKTKLRQLVTFTNVYTLGLRVSVNNPEFDYLPAVGVAEVSERHAGASASLVGGTLVRSRLFVGGKIGGEQTWRGNDPTNLCTPNATVPAVLECQTVVVGAPVKNTGLLASVVGRFIWGHIAVAPTYEWRNAKDLRTFEVPIYFIPNADGASLTGGVAYRRTGGDSQLFLFVGSGFTLFGVR
jgi:hypothetical protein